MRLFAHFMSTREIDYTKVSQYCFNVIRDDSPAIRNMGKDVLGYHFEGIEIVHDPSPHFRGNHLVLRVWPGTYTRDLQRFLGWIELMDHCP